MRYIPYRLDISLVVGGEQQQHFGDERCHSVCTYCICVRKDINTNKTTNRQHISSTIGAALRCDIVCVFSNIHQIYKKNMCVDSRNSV